MAKKRTPVKKKAAPKKRTPAQLANIARRGPLPPPLAPGEKPHPYSGLYGNRNAVGNKGKPPAYETAEEMQTQIDAYFKWIEGEKGEREQKVRDPITRKVSIEIIQYWIRPPEPATKTGLYLFMGFSSYKCWEIYEEKTATEFPLTVARAMARVTQSYELALHDRDRTNGARFALPNMGRGEWGNVQQTQSLGANGQPIDPKPVEVTLNLS